MATVTPLNPSALSNPDVSMQDIFQGVKNINRAVFFKSAQYQILQQKAERARNYAQEAESLLRRDIPSLQSELDNAAPDSYFSMIAEIEAGLKEAGLAPEDIAALQEERANTIESLSAALAETHAKFKKSSSELANKIFELEKVVLLERIEGPLADEQKRHAEILHDINVKETRKKEVSAARDKIIAAQDVIRAKNIADTFKDFLPAASDLSALDLAAPEVEAIKQSIEIARKTLGIVSDGIKYTQLADARRQLEAEMDKISADIGVLRTRLKGSDDIIEDLTAVLQIDKHKKNIITETRKIIRSWQNFTETLGALSGQQVNLQNITDTMHGQVQFLKNLLKQVANMVLV
ncbi:alpha-xenorhabdolysin family binary toxin subunit B [Massilia sp. W12]|uniref:alpha-xenorhabdolysin family binary toxin subunit B n=1 Tax=Massilia sp. W12 TaxID=3126507 RepID=UPI0030D34B5E